MVRYLEKAKTLISKFKIFSIEQIPRSDNKKADALSKIASTSFAHLTKQVLVEVLKEKSIEETEILLAAVEEEGHSWMTPLLEYLTDGTLPAEVKKARSIRIKSRQYVVINGVLYRKSFLKPWLRCVGPLQAEYVEGKFMKAPVACIVAKALRSGYYWMTMHKDTLSIIQKCKDCQVHRSVPKNPQQKLTPITSPWPSYKWGIDISGPFPEAQGKIKKFVWDNIVYRFGLPGEIISDNGNQFRDNPFKDWCEKLNVKQRLGGDNKNWVEELPHVLWAHRTEIKSSNGHTPFSLTYGTEAVIPVEIEKPSLRCEKIDPAMNDEDLLLNLDILEEMREKAAIQEAKSKAKIKRSYNVKVLNIIFKPGDFVYRNNEASHAREGEKLGPKWEGLYEVVEALDNGAYKIRNDSGDILPRT
ncbi:reverse transcriptase domain-containing protein [Tanacetum coccineum]|uniref:Reverse transcriptase domain-containing protein n=1 Tax=Tanacetum coccineum TaxID=301880 RepID=A0ABQ4Y6Q6_9ASTR